MRGLGGWWQMLGRYGKRVAVVAAVLLIAVATGLGVGFGVTALTQRLAEVSAMTAVSGVAPPPPVVPHPALRPVAADGPAPTPTGVGAVLDPLVATGGLGTLSGQVVDPATGAVLWQRHPTDALVPGSTAKLLTTSAALLALDHQQRFHTTVLAGPDPGTVVLRGGGDPTLSGAAQGTETGYPGAARLDDLVSQVRAAAPGPIRRVLVDVSRYTGDALAPGWLPSDVAGGYIAPIEPVMLDGGRADPLQDISPRAAKPATAAAAELARRLGADPDTVALGAAEPGAAVLGDVSSPPVQDLVATALRQSDNVLAETLAREVARKIGAQPSFAGASQAVLTVLAHHGFNVSGATLVDGSGLSTSDAVPATLLTALLGAAAAPDQPAALGGNQTTAGNRTTAGRAGTTDGVNQPTNAALRPLLVGLPVAGGSGTLADRYHGPSAAGRGWVRAKTGTLTGVNSLAGTVLDTDGRMLVFALLSNGPNPASVRPRLDALAAELRSCGCH
ncbi:MAG TPA: D-alanyl-D-alanine carboxypeptidase [Pseudonocardiaceae bacterium]|nr:D-alanyl-D-alanine carboxypeptidase [Pseudonocardiaceae bacterium]